MASRLLLGVLAILPLVVWPGLEEPFSAPKLAWLAVGAVALLVPVLRRWSHIPAPFGWAVLAWIASFIVATLAADLPDLRGLVLGLAAPVVAAAVAARLASPEAVVRAMAAGALGCGVTAVLQWSGADPFAWFGWHAPIDGASVRMRVYGTLGNPNFVGALMAMAIPLTVAAARGRGGFTSAGRRLVVGAAVAIDGLALMATGSRGAILGLFAAVAVYGWLRWRPGLRIAIVAATAFAALALAISPARPLDTTAAGRLHLWRIAVPHLLDRPWTGIGPGGVVVRFPSWQKRAAREGVRDPRFAGLTDHVHNDYLEAWIERGVLGLLSTLGPVLLVAVAVRRFGARWTSVASAGASAVAAGAACALVDFPLTRPTALTFWWVAVALALSRSEAIEPPVDGNLDCVERI